MAGPGVPLRSTPGFTLSPAPRVKNWFAPRVKNWFRRAPPQGGVPGRASRLGCETLRCHPLRGLRIGFAALHPRAGSPAEHLGWGARLYAVAALRGLRQFNSRSVCQIDSGLLVCYGRLMSEHSPEQI